MNKRTEMRGTLARLRISGPMTTTSATQRRKKMRNLQKAGCRLLHSFSHDEKRREDVFCVSASSRSSYDYDRSADEEGEEEEEEETVRDERRSRSKMEASSSSSSSRTTRKNAQRSRISTPKSSSPSSPSAKEGTQINQINTELVWELERKGDGWGEEIFPSLRQRRRVVEPLASKKRPNNMQAYVENYLVEVVGFTEDEAVATFSAAAAWRITAKGRALVDRKRMKLIAQNAQNAIEVFRRCGLSQEEVRQVIQAAPQLLAVSPTQSKWNFSLLEYAARQLSESGGTLGRVRMRERTGRPPLRDESGKVKDTYYARTKGLVKRVPETLREWVLETRLDRTSGSLAQEQLYLLDIVGFDAQEPETKVLQANTVWESWFDELVEYQCITGNCDPSFCEREKGGLGRWVAKQRALFKSGKLSKKREFRLRTLGLKLDEDEAESTVSVVNINFQGGLTAFDESAADMAMFLAERGQYAEPPLGSPLAVWLMKTREMAEKGELTEGQMDKLAIIGVDLTPISAAWLKNLSEMSDYVSRKRVVNLQKANSIKAWIEDQKEAYREGKLSEAQIKRLEALDPIVFLDFSTNSSSSINAR